jgi:Zn-dependent protease
VIRLDSPISSALGYAVLLNFVLFFFNLIPAHPLDGGSVARGLIPRSWLDGWDKFAVYAPFLLMALIMIPVLGRVFTWPARMVASKLYVLLGMVFGLG